MKQGISPNAAPVKPAGTVDLVLDSKNYQILKFDLSPDGESLVVQRANRQKATDVGLWLVKAGTAPQQIKTDPAAIF